MSNGGRTRPLMGSHRPCPTRSRASAGARPSIGQVLPACPGSMAEVFLLPGGNLSVLGAQIGIGALPDEHAHVGGAGHAQRLGDGHLSVALVPVDHHGRDRAGLIEKPAVVGLGFLLRDDVDAIGTLRNAAAAGQRENGQGAVARLKFAIHWNSLRWYLSDPPPKSGSQILSSQTKQKRGGPRQLCAR